eukprot:CAMPEP_0206011014 /NCGR_PEP_ID=MMETSP1464-20131121/12534_1 /ASSEMBLY_ACC=CAM_ASM_001124 /TAXON_ID=119497 /ORGANISM="Exanthemachrysis gayraliae, Strain RCC1523" /LENGTH=135 /DNA_ID=CAMNT_0053384661 /DNA_START=113 /DNA_END=521 /DNA_ORIENTATION=-
MAAAHVSVILALSIALVAAYNPPSFSSTSATWRSAATRAPVTTRAASVSAARPGAKGASTVRGGAAKAAPQRGSKVGAKGSASTSADKSRPSPGLSQQRPSSSSSSARSYSSSALVATREAWACRGPSRTIPHHH